MLKAHISAVYPLRWSSACELRLACELHPVSHHTAAEILTEQSARMWFVVCDACSHILFSSACQYRAVNQPWYHFGHGIVLLYIGLGLIFSTAYFFYLRRENGLRARGFRDEVIDNDPSYTAGAGVDREKETDEARVERAARNGRFATVDDAKREKGDSWSGYRYTL